ncbi:MAG TPA: phosphate acyltransferase, partial [Thermohalobaculum sp.]|nr:phosphate acyltransferase [Thermohalobaculum sp.]
MSAGGGLMERLRERARARQGRVVLPEGEDERVREAAARLAAEGLARPLLIGGEAPGAETLVADDHPEREKLAAAIAARRERMSVKMAERSLVRPLWFG